MDERLVRDALIDLRDRVDALEARAPAIDLDRPRADGKVRIPHRGGTVTFHVEWLRGMCDRVMAARNKTWDEVEAAK